MENKRKVGSIYEDKACDYLTKKGYRIIARNYHAGKRSEIDIMAYKDGVYVAVECKYRSGDLCGDPLEAVNFRKQQSISRALLHFYMKHQLDMDTPARFDVIAIYGDERIEHIENAFSFVN